MKIAFSFFLLIYSRCGAPASWAVRHTIVCLDVNVMDETSLANMPAPSQQAETDTPSTSEPYGTNLELIDDDDMEDAVIPILLPTTDTNAIRRYPVR